MYIKIDLVLPMIRFNHIFCIGLFHCFFITISGYSQNTILREIRIEKIPKPDQVDVFVNHQEYAALVVRSSIPNLIIDSNLGIVADLTESGSGIYRVILRPGNQIITYKAQGYISAIERITDLRAPRDIVYYLVEQVETVEKIPITFRVEPKDANVIIDNEDFGEIGTGEMAVRLAIGDHTVKLQREGYRDIEELIIVDPRKSFYEYNLNRIDPLLITINSQPAGAKVILDGIEIGETDTRGTLQLFRFPGEYDITILSNGYSALTNKVSVQDNRENTFSFDLSRNSANLVVSTVPSNAQILLNKKQIESGVNQELAPGLYRVEIILDGYVSITEDIQIELGEMLNRDYTLTPHVGRVQYTVSPSFSLSTLKDSSGNVIKSWVGSRLLSDIAVGSYELLISAEGYDTKEKTIQIRKDETSIIQMMLNKSAADLEYREGEFFTVVESMPELIGGMDGLQQNIIYPEKARRAGIEGRVYLQFIVNERGEVENPRVIRGIGGGCDEVALEAVKRAKFIPGLQRDRPVPVQSSLSIVFKLKN